MLKSRKCTGWFYMFIKPDDNHDKTRMCFEKKGE